MCNFIIPSKHVLLTAVCNEILEMLTEVTGWERSKRSR